jgi:hypothetical protein
MDTRINGKRQTVINDVKYICIITKRALQRCYKSDRKIKGAQFFAHPWGFSKYFRYTDSAAQSPLPVIASLQKFGTGPAKAQAAE